jgi:hypothetical protein
MTEAPRNAASSQISADGMWEWNGTQWIPASRKTPSGPRWLFIVAAILFFPITVVILIVRSKWSVRTKAIASGAWIVVLITAGISGQMQPNPQPVATGTHTVASASSSPVTSPATSPATVAAQSPGQQSPPAVVSPTPVAVVQPVVAPPVVAPPVVAPPVVAPPPVDPYAAATAAGASAVCADGTWSYSQHRSGTCSGHGGVHWWTGNLGAAGPGAH